MPNVPSDKVLMNFSLVESDDDTYHDTYNQYSILKFDSMNFILENQYSHFDIFFFPLLFPISR